MIGSPTYNITNYLAKLPKHLLSHTKVHVKNSAALVQVLDEVTVSLFTKVPLKPTIERMAPLFSEPMVKLFE